MKYSGKAAARRKLQQRRIIFLCIATIFVFIMGITCGSILSKAQESSYDYTARKYYANIEIQPGDTLWDLADRYMDDHFSSKQEYIREVAQINSLNEDGIISGQYLIMPYYSH